MMQTPYARRPLTLGDAQPLRYGLAALQQLAQLPAKNLAARIALDFLHKVKPARRLEVGNAPIHEPGYRAPRQLGAVPGDQERMHALAPTLVRHTHDRRFQDIG